MNASNTNDSHYTIQSVDGADDDGTTLYILRDQYGRIVTSASVPQPLEAVAAICGYPVVRANAWVSGGPDSYDR